MIDHSAGNPSRETSHRETLHKAVSIELGEAEILDAIAEDPSLVEPGWTILARDVRAGDGPNLPLVALDERQRPVLVTVQTAGDPAPLLASAIDGFERLQGHWPLLRQALSRSGSTELSDEVPRVVLLAHSFSDAFRRACTRINGIPITLLHYRALGVGDRVALLVESAEGPGTPHSGGGPARPAEADTRTARLLADARSRLLNLSPEITASEAPTGVSFRYRGHDLVGFERTADGIRVVTSREPTGRKVIGRSDLEEALHGVIEEFFALYTAARPSERLRAVGSWSDCASASSCSTRACHCSGTC